MSTRIMLSTAVHVVALLALATAAAGVPASSVPRNVVGEMDRRDLFNGTVMLSSGYLDQPYSKHKMKLAQHLDSRCILLQAPLVPVPIQRTNGPNQNTPC